MAAKGVEFEDLQNPDIPQDEKKAMRGLSQNMGPDIAWFEDPASNVLAVMPGRLGFNLIISGQRPDHSLCRSAAAEL